MQPLWSQPGNPGQLHNLSLFRELMVDYGQRNFFHPNYEKAPWHVQARFGPTLVNFWPHRLRAATRDFGSARGQVAIYALLDRILAAAEPKP